MESIKQLEDIDNGKLNKDLIDYNIIPTIDKIEILYPDQIEGCHPKFIASLSFKNNVSNNFSSKKWIIKPLEIKSKERDRQVLNELFAYSVNKVMSFNRVPIVIPIKIEKEMIEKLLIDYKKNLSSHSNFIITKFCNPQYSLNRWIFIENNTLVNDTLTKYLVATAQLMINNVSKGNAVTYSTKQWISSKIGYKYFNYNISQLTVFQQREIGTRTLFDYIIGNNDRYVNDFIQKLSKYRKILTYLDNSKLDDLPYMLNMTMGPTSHNCRFYFRPLKDLFAINMYTDRHVRLDLKQLVISYMMKYKLVKILVNDGVINLTSIHSNINILNQRVLEVRNCVEQCVKKYGFYYVYSQV